MSCGFGIVRSGWCWWWDRLCYRSRLGGWRGHGRRCDRARLAGVQSEREERAEHECRRCGSTQQNLSPVDLALLAFVHARTSPPRGENRNEGQRHAPITHDRTPQLVEQLPQCADVSRRASQPLASFPSQLPEPSKHTIPQCPNVHTGIAPGDGHRIPHPPQWLKSVRVSVSQPLAAIPSQSAKPIGHTGASGATSADASGATSAA